MAPEHSKSPGGEVLAHLRTATRPLHERLEDRLDLPRHLRSIAEYCSLLADFHGFYAPLEASLSCIDWNGTGIAFEERRKTPLLRDDLASLGLSEEDVSRLPRCDRIPPMSCRNAAFGGLYVVEGATLGGQLITRHIREAFGQDPAAPSAFFASYGERVGRMWRAFREALARNCGVQDREIVAHAAVETFEGLEAWLFRQRG